MKAVAEHFPTFDRFRTRLSAVNYWRIARRCLVPLAVVTVVVASGSGAVWHYLRFTSTRVVAVKERFMHSLHRIPLLRFLFAHLPFILAVAMLTLYLVFTLRSNCR